MTTIDTPVRASSAPVSPAKNGVGKEVRAPSDGQKRAIHDTVSLSEGGQKVVNLNRGAALAEDIKNAAVDENFAEKLKRATDDIFRINTLFTQTIRSLFSWLR